MALAATAIMLTAPAPATAASPTKGATYRGDFGEDTMVEVRVSRSGKGFADVSIDMFIRCSNGIQQLGSLLWFAGEVKPRRVRIARDGSFSALFDEPEFPDAFTASEEYWLSGRFIRRGKAARLVVRTRLVGEGGTVCDTGDQRVIARRVRPR